MENRENGKMRRLDFAEFLRLCSDAGLLDAETQKSIQEFARVLGGVGSLPYIEANSLDDYGDYQEVLQAAYPDEMTFSSFVTTDDNFYPVEIARTVALVPKIWKSITPVMIHASYGLGKTHLLTAMAKASSMKTMLINTVDLHIEFRNCNSALRERQLREWLSGHELLLLDDIQFCQGDLAFQRFLLSLLNRMPRETHGLVTASDETLSQLVGLDESFFSRLTSGLVIELPLVDLDGRRKILENLFSHSGIPLPPEDVTTHIAENFHSNIRQLKAAGRMVLAKMLGPSAVISIDSISGMLSSLKKGGVSKQKEFRASMANMISRHTEAPPPFIVVDIEGEQPADRKPTPKEDPPKPEPARPKPPDSQKYRDMVASAETVDRQVTTLTMAISDRMEFLRKQNASASEIAKLEQALAHLLKGDLEGAMKSLASGKIKTN
jgi:hypothetical protein